jgi:hypothetical protein
MSAKCAVKQRESFARWETLRMITDKRLIVAMMVGVVSPIIAIVAASRAFDDWRLRARGQETPQDIRAADLAEHGPGDNVYVNVTDFQLGKDYIVEELRGQWNSVYIPVYPRSPDGKVNGRAETPKIVVRTGKIRSRADVAPFYRTTVLTGVITNSIDKANFDLREFRKRFPDIKPAEVWLICDARPFPSEASVYFNAGLAGGLVLLGIVGLVFCWKFAVRQEQAEARRKEEVVVFRR